MPVSAVTILAPWFAGVRYSPTATAEGSSCPFLTLGSAFNHERLYVNCQASAAVAAVDFKFEDQKHWRCFVPQPLPSAARATSSFELQVKLMEFPEQLDLEQQM